MAHKLRFQPRARLLLQLGDQLIRSESIALLEVIKNAYDANASCASISMRKLDTPEEGEIIIEDDGDGMDISIIRDVWMQPGSDYKTKITKASKVSSAKEPKRIPIGGKGIGRFGVHKLGYKIQLISRKANAKEVKLEIDWRVFEQDTLLANVDVELVEHQKPTHFTGDKHGTRIVISDLKGHWTKATVRELYRAVTSLNSPFETADSFSTYFKLDHQEWLTGLLSFKDIKSYALYYADVVISGNKIKTLKYEFRPWDTMSKLASRKEALKDIPMATDAREGGARKKSITDIDLGEFDIGTVRLKLLIFDRASKVLSLGVTDKDGFREYLNTNGGIRVFRDGIRVYDYGEPENDWLSLDLMRVNQPGKTISNNIIIGAISLDGKDSADLQEKTNREGFIENKAYREFVLAIRFALDKILTQRNLDKKEIRKLYSHGAVSEPVIGHLRTLQEKITEKIDDESLRKDLLRSISNIEKDYETINQIYTRSSSAGLSLSIVMHEMIHMITELAIAVDNRDMDQHIRQLVRTLQKTANDYAGVIKQSNKTKVQIGNVIRHALSNIQFRLRAHQIEIIPQFEANRLNKAELSCAQNLVMSSIINIIDNSIWWQSYAKVAKKKIYIDLINYPKNHLSILIADNGPGFTIPPDEATKPFISDKPGGMGLGLHLASEVMNSQKGQLLFPEYDELTMPPAFKRGAKILLAFKKD